LEKNMNDERQENQINDTQPELPSPPETQEHSQPESGAATVGSATSSVDALETSVTDNHAEINSGSEKLDGQSVLRLHTPRPPVTRLKPKVVGLLLLAAASAVGVAFFVGLGSGGAPVVRKAQNPDVTIPSSDTANDNPLLTDLPQTYTWPASLNHQTNQSGQSAQPAVLGNTHTSAASSAVSTAEPASDEAQERLEELRTLQNQWREALNSPEVFAGITYSLGGNPRSRSPQTSDPDSDDGLIGSAGVLTPALEPSDANGDLGSDATGYQGNDIQQAHSDFLRQVGTVQPYLAQPLIAPTSPYEIQAGTVIPGALVTGINSDLPGQIIGMVTQNVFDSVTGQYLLIPQGSRLLGRYSSVVGNGENRVLIVWQRLILPNGDSMVLGAMPGTDQEGQSGLNDQVNYHFDKLAEAAALSTVIAYGGNLAINPNSTSNNQDIVGDTIAQEGSQIGQQIINRQLDVQPTITIRPGWPFRVLVNQDMILKPYQP
jgi:type IV secretion system protein TrbI